MNFLPCRLVGENGSLSAPVGDGGAEIRLPPSNTLAATIDKDIEIGLHLEHRAIQTSGEDIDPGRSFPLPMEVVELLGAETLIFTTISEAEVVARRDPRLHPHPGDRLTAVVDTTKLHLIDPESDRVIGR